MFAWWCRRHGRSRNITMHCFDWHSTDRWTADQKHNTQRKNPRYVDPTCVVKWLLFRLRQHHSEESVHNWSFPCQEMQCEVRVVKGHIWEGEPGGTFNDGRLVVTCWRRILRHNKLWRCLSRRVSKSWQKLLLIWISAVRDDPCEKGWNRRDSWACNSCETWSWPGESLWCAIIMAAAVAGRKRGSLMFASFEPVWRTQRGRPGKKIVSSLLFERNTLPTTNEFIELDGAYGWWQRVSPKWRQQETVVCQSGTWRNVCDTNGWFWTVWEWSQLSWRCCQVYHLGFPFQIITVSRKTPTRMLRGDINWNEFERHAGYPIAEAKYLQTLMELVVDGGRKYCKCFCLKSSAVNLCLCAHLTKFCWDSSPESHWWNYPFCDDWTNGVHIARSCTVERATKMFKTQFLEQ